MSIELQSAVATSEAQASQPTSASKAAQGYTTEQQAIDDVKTTYNVNEADKEEAARENDSQEERELSKTEIAKVAQQLQEFVKSLNRNVQFSVDENSGKDVISVIEVDSGELIRQIPSEEVLRLASSISKAAGLIVQEKV